MRYFIISLILLALNLSVDAQVETDSLGFERFLYTEGDTTYTMKKYFMVFLKSGEVRSQNAEEAERIQAEHLAHLDSLQSIGALDMAGPFGDNGEIRGIVILRVPTLEQAEALCNADPAVKAKRLKVEVHPWWAAEGTCLR
jgi:uncharacterized protein YciI